MSMVVCGVGEFTVNLTDEQVTLSGLTKPGGTAPPGGVTSRWSRLGAPFEVVAVSRIRLAPAVNGPLYVTSARCAVFVCRECT
jgi:hypothetical protein